MGAAAVARRVDRAARLLMAGRSPSAVVATLADEMGVSRRTARRDVAKAYQLILDDINEIDVNRQQLVAQVLHCLMEGMAAALAGGHISAAVGCARELRELGVLTGPPSRPRPPERYMHHA